MVRPPLAHAWIEEVKMSEDKKKNTGLSKEISFRKKTSKWPSKKGINFISDQQERANKKALIWFLVFLILLVPFTYFGVYGMIAKVNAAEAQYNQVQQQINTYKETTSDYDEVKKQYDTVVGSFLTDDEKACTDRLKIFQMVEEDIMPSASIQSIAVNGAQVTVVTGTTDLATVSSMIVKLQADTRNSYVTVTTTTDSTSQNTNAVIATFEITYATAVSSTTTGGTN